MIPVLIALAVAAPIPAVTLVLLAPTLVEEWRQARRVRAEALAAADLGWVEDLRGCRVAQSGGAQ